MKCILFPALVVLASLTQALAQEKVVVLGSDPRPTGPMEVLPDGSKLYMAGSAGKFLVVDASGKLLDQYGVPQRQSPRELVPLKDGSFIAINTYAGGSINRYRPDGTLERRLVGKGQKPVELRADMTGWTSPTGGTVDEVNGLLFALDTTMAAKGLPDPAHSQIMVFDFEGKHVRNINPHDNDAGPSEAGRTWYDDIEVDPARKRVYVTTRPVRELRAFDYEGNLIKAVPGSRGVAVLPDGRVATIVGEKIRIYTPELELSEEIDRTPEHHWGTVNDLEADAQGRLYATMQSPTVTFVRFSSDLKTHETIGPDYLRLIVQRPAMPLIAGKPAELRAIVAGRPEPKDASLWQLMLRPSDGRTLHWRQIEPVEVADGMIRFTVPRDVRGLYDLVVKYGKGPINWADRRSDVYVQMTLSVAAEGAPGSVSVIPAAGRRAYLPGEAIPLQVVVKHPETTARTVRLELWRDKTLVASTETDVTGSAAVQIAPIITRRLLPGEYRIVPVVEELESWPLHILIGPPRADSPMQRIQYLEFDDSPMTQQNRALADNAERQAYLRDFVRATAGLGFTRQTDRLAMRIPYDSGPTAWRRDSVPADVSAPQLPPAEYFAAPAAQWEAEYYLDLATRWGIFYDTQLLGHCSSIRFHDRWRPQHVQVIQRVTQWLGRYPSFYGWNWNDEMFFTGYTANEWTDEDKQWLERMKKEMFEGKPTADLRIYAHEVMYSYFHAALDQVEPNLKRTTTPMWQFPAVEGSYAPAIYDDMSESYTHFLSEGYSAPFIPSHNVEFLRRPDKPIMAVFDNGYRSIDGEVYLKNIFQVGFRGVQGVGVQHTKAFDAAGGASAMRLGNTLMKEFGPILATCPAANEASILHSYTQDITEKRNNFGTPHWERVYFMHGVSLMAGVPTDIVYEEDIIAGRLFDGDKPRVPMLFLLGITQELPPKVKDEIARFQKAGGQVFYDADGKDYPGATQLPIKTHEIGRLLLEGYAADTVFPLMFDVYEAAARQLRDLVGEYRRMPIDADEPWVTLNRLDGGAVQYVGISRETGPYPWDAGTVWSLGAFYNKGSLPWLPKIVNLQVSAEAGAVYDVFEHKRVEAPGGKIAADLRLLPGRLYAFVPREVEEPALLAGVRDNVARFEVNVGMPARIPLRVRLYSGETQAIEFYAATGADGKLSDSLTLPAGAGEWTLEVTEMLGGKGTTVELTATPLAEMWLTERPAVEVQRAQQIRELLKLAEGKLLLSVQPDVLDDATKQRLVDALKSKQITLDTTTALPDEPAPGVVLAAGIYPAEGSLSPVLRLAWARGLFREPLAGHVPGKGRGLVQPLFSPRGYQEHAIALVGGDAEGLKRSIDAFIELLGAEEKADAPSRQPMPNLDSQPTIAEIAPVPTLSERVGARLSEIKVSPDGRHLLVAANGWLKNLALVQVDGGEPKVVRAERIGASPTLGSLFVTDDGRRFGAAARFTGRFGEAMQILSADDPAAASVVAAFGNFGRTRHGFGVSSDGNTVIVGGTYGIACFRREGDAWREVWAIDYWKEFPSLDWPISAESERIPQFHALIPHGSDTAIVLFGELSNQGWVTPVNHGSVSLSAVSVADGSVKWKFDVPVIKMLMFPTLHASPQGKHTLLEVQLGGWGKETFRFYKVVEGKAVAEWNADQRPKAVAISDETGWMSLVYGDRLLEIRRDDGSLSASMLWSDQPVSVALAPGGRSLYVADDAGKLSRIDSAGDVVWSKQIGVNAALAVGADRVYAAGWDGRLRCFAETGDELWTIDLTPHLLTDDPMATVVAADKAAGERVVVAKRASTATSTEPGSGENLLASGKAKLTLGGTRGWMSGGAVQVKPEQLTNGQRDDVAEPWLHLDELFWDASAGRQVFAEIAFEQPTDVTEVTVFENPNHPESFPTESLIQVWDEASQSWKTAARGVFLEGPVNTYRLDLKGVTKLRYVPWADYWRNFYTSEIEVR